MGMLNLFKKNKQPEPGAPRNTGGLTPPRFNGLDIPPIPTSDENFSGQLPDLPELDIPMPPKNSELEENIEEFQPSPRDIQDNFSKEVDLPEIPSMPGPIAQSENVPEQIIRDIPEIPPIEQEAEDIMPPPPPEGKEAHANVEMPLPPNKMDAKKVEEIFSDDSSKEFPEKPKREMGGSIFVNVDEYKEILNGTSNIMNNLKEAEEVVSRLNELKLEKDKEFEKWRGKLEDVERKLIFIDKTIFEANY